MRKLIVFNSVSLDGYFTGANGDLSWAHTQDAEFQEFVQANARGAGELLFGRITYDMMVSFWPTPQAAQSNPVVAEGMNNAAKVVFSRTMDAASWKNTRLVTTDPSAAVRKMKNEPGPLMVIMGSGTIVARLAQDRLIDEYQLVVVPVALGKGRTLFEGITEKVALKLISSRSFRNGNLFLCYEPMA
jgi:dihydrofolate reductase